MRRLPGKMTLCEVVALAIAAAVVALAAGGW